MKELLSEFYQWYMARNKQDSDSNLNSDSEFTPGHNATEVLEIASIVAAEYEPFLVKLYSEKIKKMVSDIKGAISIIHDRQKDMLIDDHNTACSGTERFTAIVDDHLLQMAYLKRES